MNARTVFAALLLAAASAAHAAPSDDASGYLTSGSGQVVTDGFGDCWHTGEWTAGMHSAQCDRRPVKAVAPMAKPAFRAPEPVAAAPKPPAPKPVPLSLSTDALFDFDRATLKSEGRVELDKLAKEILEDNYRTIDITGHSDRIGAPAYNRLLSERRAQTVSDYLAVQGADTRKIHTQGVGSSEPLTAKDQCSGLPRKELVECLQPDRYVEVKVLGTQTSALR